MTEKELYDMKLHEVKEIYECESSALDVLRVVGGWIYTKYNYFKGIDQIQGTFVPEPPKRIIRISKDEKGNVIEEKNDTTI